MVREAAANVHETVESRSVRAPMTKEEVGRGSLWSESGPGQLATTIWREEYVSGVDDLGM